MPARARDALAALEDEARRTDSWSAVEDSYGSLRSAWTVGLEIALHGRGCREGPTLHHHHRRSNADDTASATYFHRECPALCTVRCGRGPGTLAAVTGERCVLHRARHCGAEVAGALSPVVPCPRYTPGLRDLAERFGEFTDPAAGLSIVADGVLLHRGPPAEWVSAEDAPPALLRARAAALRAFLERALAAYEVRAAAEAAAARAAGDEVREATLVLYRSRRPPSPSDP